jgi:iron complex transport system ATP-binding protein
MSLEIRDINVTRGGRKTLADVSLSLAGGGVTAVVGPNGAGKSTFLSALAGLLPHDGAIAWKGVALDRRALAYMPQNTDVRSALTVLEVMLLGRLERLGVRVGNEDIADAMALLARFGLADLASRAMPTLSGGQRQLVMLSQRLMRRPEILIMDEPTSALDIRHQMEALGHIETYARDSGALVLIALHDINLAARFCGQMLLFARGRLIGAGAQEDVLTAATIRGAYGVEAEFVASPAGHRVFIPTGLAPAGF